MGLLTVGHGTLETGALAALLAGAGVESVVDVRRAPGSRRHPQLGRRSLEAALPAAGVAYRWEQALGGWRTPAEDSPNTALRNRSFRGYADHMGSEEFRAAAARLADDAGALRQAIMCSESVWWRCHRRLVADHLALVHGVDVLHLMHDGRLVAHALTDGARRAAAAVRYDAA